MKNNTTRILLAAGAGFTLGSVCGQQASRRKNTAVPPQQLPTASTPDKAQERQLKQIRKVLNDTHKHVVAVSKGLQKPAA